MKLPVPKALTKPQSPGDRGNGAVPAVKEAPADLVGWLDERTGGASFLTGMLYRKVPKGTNWLYTLGSATLFAFTVQAVTGVFLAMFYTPSPTQAYSSITHLTNDVFLMRGLERRGEKELFMKGRLPFPIDIVNAQPGRTVSFRAMRERIGNVDFSVGGKGPPGPR